MAKPTNLPEWDTTQVNAIEPTTERKEQGWLAPGGVPEKPPFQTFNYWQNEVYRWLKAINAQGILEYDNLTDYVANLSYVVGSDGNLYACKINNGQSSSVVDPVGDLTGTWILANSDSWKQNNFLQIQDQKTLGTQGGTSVSSTWQTRDLNTVVTNTISGASLSSNAITLPSGRYYINACAPCFESNRNRLKLYNTTDAIDVIFSRNGYNRSTDETVTETCLTGEFTITATKTFELQQMFETGISGVGLGQATSMAIEIYTNAEIWRVGE